MMHALGFLHEHQRWDRDKFINFNSTNVLPGQISQFTKLTWREWHKTGYPFELGSTMMYWSRAYAEEGFTMTLKAGTLSLDEFSH